MRLLPILALVQGLDARAAVLTVRTSGDLVRAMHAAGLKDVRVRSLTGIARVFAVAFTGRA